jgi:hypothetical protein
MQYYTVRLSVSSVPQGVDVHSPQRLLHIDINPKSPVLNPNVAAVDVITCHTNLHKALAPWQCFLRSIQKENAALGPCRTFQDSVDR